MNIKYIKGDATNPITKNNVIIPHICNNIGMWGAGFVLALSNKWPNTRKEYLKWYQTLLDGKDNDNVFELGNVQYVNVDYVNNIFVLNMIAQNNIKNKFNQNPIDYEALDKCLKKLSVSILGLNYEVHMPKIGTGLAGGDWNIIEEIIIHHLINNNIKVVVYIIR